MLRVEDLLAVATREDDADTRAAFRALDLLTGDNGVSIDQLEAMRVARTSTHRYARWMVSVMDSIAAVPRVDDPYGLGSYVRYVLGSGVNQYDSLIRAARLGLTRAQVKCRTYGLEVVDLLDATSLMDDPIGICAVARCLAGGDSPEFNAYWFTRPCMGDPLPLLERAARLGWRAAQVHMGRCLPATDFGYYRWHLEALLTADHPDFLVDGSCRDMIAKLIQAAPAMRLAVGRVMLKHGYRHWRCINSEFVHTTGSRTTYMTTGCGLPCADWVNDLFETTDEYARWVNGTVKPSIMTWMLCATRMGMQKDMRVLIGKMVWMVRHAAWNPPAIAEPPVKRLKQ